MRNVYKCENDDVINNSVRDMSWLRLTVVQSGGAGDKETADEQSDDSDAQTAEYDAQGSRTPTTTVA